MSDMSTRNVAIYIFDEIEVLDFCGPFEVFTVAGRKGAFNVYTVAEQEHTISTRGGMQVIPRYTWENAPAPHIIVVPGGKGAEQLVDHAPTVNWVRATAASAELVLSVCTGALLLGKAGLLDGLTATTHHKRLARLRECAPGAMVVSDRRYVDNGKIVTSAGVSAGVDASLHVVERVLGRVHAEETAANMEYDWRG
ncbi:MAG: DJ-1/PfpI family protein [Candidatus Tectomicrobia bacterium]